MRSLERDQKQLEDDHNKARLYLRYLQDGARKVDNAFASEQELNCDVKRIEECIKDNEIRLQELKGQAERNRTPFREQMTEAYQFEAPFENSSWPTQPIFSPLFWQRLRQTKAGSGLLEDDIDKVAILRSELSLSTTAISGTAPAVLQLTADLKTAEARLDTRRRNHEVQEAALLLDLAAPILEAERLIDRDRLRASTVDVEFGEPVLFVNDLLNELTVAQRNKIRIRLRKSMVKADRCRTLLESLTENYSDDLSEFLRIHPAQSESDFDRQDLVYRMQATQRLVEADEEEHDLSSQAMKANLIARDHDFVRDAADEKHERPLPDATFRAKALSAGAQLLKSGFPR
ncbi:hypothetical protein LTR37_008067 [Vermiconidia calcicola]|uniref:Uncharacterized protein n=1 Tax=Vermiconidia calcicola TaxID=1690605 RepID=A0ACC3NBQ7_9PEZI|nr:hypothetical protein LTR37_008067 [Vermiconidia calcicola]